MYYSNILKMAAVAAFCLTATATQAATVIGYGDTVAITDCAPCEFDPNGLNVGYFIGGFDHFGATFSGSPLTSLTWILTPAVDMQFITSGVGGTLIDPNGGGSSGVYDLSSGFEAALSLGFDSSGFLTVNTVTQTGALAQGDSLFLGGPFVIGEDFATGESVIGTFEAISNRICEHGVSGDACLPSGGNPSVVPLPASGWFLLAGLSALGWRENQRRGVL